MAIPAIRPRRAIDGCSAVLLSFRADGGIDWSGFERHVERTAAAGLTPAVNMDTGWVHVIGEADRLRALDIAASCAKSRFLAGAYVADEPGARFGFAAYARAIAEIARQGGTPVLFPSHGLRALDEDAWVDAHRRIGAECGAFIAFELGEMFHPAGRIVSIDAYRGLLGVPHCIGAKHSSLDRELEWQRLALRDAVRADFKVYTGNDLAIDMVMWGSDYLLGLSTFAPDLFAIRDARWAAGDPSFHELNDLLQYLGQLAFRAPVPAYRHSAAQFLKLRGWAESDAIPDGQPRRPASDIELLADVLRRLEAHLP